MKIVVVEDNEILRKREINYIKRGIDNVLYELCEYDDFNNELKNIIKQDDFKIYILDIELPSSSGINIARYVREYDDISEIIICSSHSELEYEVFKSKLKIIDFISKYNNMEENLINLIKDIIRKKSRKILKITDKCGIRFIIIDYVLYIMKEKSTRNCIIKTTNQNYIINKSLNELEKILPDNFIKVSRSCLVNQNNVEEYNFKDSKVKFKNGEEIDAVLKSFIEKIKF